jgi:hypothetical protein
VTRTALNAQPGHALRSNAAYLRGMRPSALSSTRTCNRAHSDGMPVPQLRAAVRLAVGRAAGAETSSKERAFRLPGGMRRRYLERFIPPFRSADTKISGQIVWPLGQILLNRPRFSRFGDTSELLVYK